jgi:hypothetical protein
MHSAHDLVTRWPALDAAARRARLQHSLHLSAGSIARAVKELAGLERR